MFFEQALFMLHLSRDQIFIEAAVGNEHRTRAMGRNAATKRFANTAKTIKQRTKTGR